jgi:hypothetical protein
MPIVFNRSAIAVNADPARARGINYKSVDTVSNLITDSVGSKYLLMNLPAEASLLPGTQFGVNLWGYADIRIGTFSDPVALVSVLRSAGAVVTPIAFNDARHGQPLWQQLGLAADPGGEIGIYAHGSVAVPTVGGSMRFTLDWTFR